MLAPIDFTRTTVPDVITTTLLPYCDGDVSDQQGQHFYARAAGVAGRALAPGPGDLVTGGAVRNLHVVSLYAA